MTLKSSTLAALLAALIAVENPKGDPRAVGDNGKAIGILQIHKIAVDDVNRLYPVAYKWPDDCYNEERSKQIAYLYMSYYAKTDDPIEWARIWNGGPKGASKTSTLIYANKVRKHL